DWEGKRKQMGDREKAREQLAGANLGGWSKDVFRFPGVDGGVEIDTQAGKVTQTKDKLPLLKAPGEVGQVVAFAGSKALLCSYDQRVDEKKEDSPRHSRLEIQFPGDKKRKVILQSDAKVSYRFELYFTPSPDDKFVAVRCSQTGTKDGEGEVIYVIDAKGEIAAKVAAE